MVLAFVVLAVPFGPSHAQPAATTPLTVAEQAAIDRAIERGRLMYSYDQAAWHGTDDLVSRLRAAKRFEAVAPSIGGWVVEQDGNVFKITFFDKSLPEPLAIYRAAFAAGETKVRGARLVENASERRLTARELELARAVGAGRAAWQRSKPLVCSAKPPNSIAIPGTDGQPTAVYLLTPQIEHYEVPFGGHYRFDIASDGTTAQTRAFSKSCLTIDKRQGPRNGRVAMVVVSHLLDPVPTEVHVFQAMTTQTRVAVVTSPSGRIWSIDPQLARPSITLIGTVPTKRD